MSFLSSLGMGAAEKLIGNLSDRFGTGASLRHQQQREEMGIRGQQYQQDLEYQPQITRAEIAARVDAAKAAGLHPMAAFGMSGSSSSPVLPSYVQQSSGSISGGVRNAIARQEVEDTKRLREAQVKETEANARRANADADFAELQVRKAEGRLVTQPGQPKPVVEVPRKVMVPEKGNPSSVHGNAASHGRFVIRDIWGKDRVVSVPIDEYGNSLENMGELAGSVVSVPDVARILWAQYLATPSEVVQEGARKGVGDTLKIIPYVNKRVQH